MKKLLFVVSLLFAFTAISTQVTGQQGEAMLKIVMSEDGSVEVFPMQSQEKTESNLVKISVPDTLRKILASGANLTLGPSSASYNYSHPQLTISVHVKNDGDVPAGASTLGYYLSQDTHIQTNDCKLGDDDVPYLYYGDDTQESITINDICNKSCVTPGTWYVGFILDESNVVPESNENDNSYYFGDSIQVPDCGGCSIEVTNPSGGEHWQEGTSHTVNWDHTGCSGEVEIHLSYDSGNSWPVTLSSGTSNDGSKSVTMPDVDEDKTHCRIRVRCKADYSCYDVCSDFTIVCKCIICTFKITQPSGGEHWQEGTSHTVNWDHTGCSGEVEIHLSYDSGNSWPVTLSSGTSNDGSESIMVPDVDEDKTHCRIRVRCKADYSCYYVCSDFTIVCACGPLGSIKPDAPTTVICGEEFYIPILVGDPNPVNNFFGVSFDLNYPTTNIDYVSSQISDPDGATANFLGNDLVFLPTGNDAAGTVSIGVSRKAGQGGVSGNGTVVWIKFTSLVTTPDPTTINWTISNITANDPNGNPIGLTPLTGSTVVTCGCKVWPGDANNDGICNSADVLRIGLFFYSTGPSRPGASIIWKEQSVECWTPENATYADGNGNGSVGSEDVLPIGLNFKKTHTGPTAKPEMTAVNKEFSKNAPTISRLNFLQTPTIKASLDTVDGDIINVNVEVIDATDLFGIAFDLVFSSTSEGIASGTAVADTFMGNDIIFLPTNLDSGFSVGISRKAGQGGVTGMGSIVQTTFTGFDAVPEETEITFTIQNVTSNDPIGNSITFTIGDPLIVHKFPTAVETKAPIPENFELSQNFPNPFNPETTIHFTLPTAVNVSLKVYDILGKEVRTLVDEFKSTGTHSIKWDGKDKRGIVLPSSIYIYKLTAGHFTEIKKLLFLK